MAVDVQLEMLVDGKASGDLLVLSEGLSFWGGLDPATGLIIDRQHPEHGACVTAAVLVLPAPRGSTAAPGALLECLASGKGPAAIILAQRDPTAVAAVLAAAMIDLPTIPVARLPGPGALQTLPDRHWVSIDHGLLKVNQAG